MTDMNEFLELAHRAGIGTLNSLAIAEALEISTSYVAKLRSGSDPLRPPVRAKLDALIAAKGDGTVDQAIIDEADDSVEPSREQFEVDLPADREPLRAKFPTGAQKFFYIPGFDGTATVVGEIAQFRSETEAARYVEFLNKGGG